MKNLANYKIPVRSREYLIQAIFQMLFDNQIADKIISQFKEEHKTKKVDDLTKNKKYFISAKDLVEKQHKENLFINIRRIFSRFWKVYFLRKGYKEKGVGIVIALVACQIGRASCRERV